MTAATQGRSAARVGSLPLILSMLLPLAASTVVYQGTMVMVPYAGTDNGYLKPAAAGSAPSRVIGVAQRSVDNSLGIAGQKSVEVAVGVFEFANSGTTDAITASHIGQPCYAADDSTVARTRGTTGQRPYAGRIVGVENGQVAVEVGSARDAEGCFDVPLIAAADYSVTGQFLFMAVNSSSQAVKASAAGQDVAGILQNAPANGAIAMVRMFGESQVYGGGAVAAGATIATTAAGKSKVAVAAAVSGADTTGSFAMGKSLSLGALDALHRVFLSPMGAIPTVAA